MESERRVASRGDGGVRRISTTATDVGGGGGEEWRWWEGMSPEVLALIFSRVPADMVLRSVPFVCKSWRDAVAGPYCWSEVDLEQWCRRVDRTDVIDFAVRKLVRRSSGTLRRLSAYRLGNSGFSFACSSGRLMKVLQIPMSDVTDRMVEKHAASLPMLTVLDISYCLGITSVGIETLGKHCKFLVQLRRNMPPPALEVGLDNGASAKIDEAEAMAVANTMPALEHLELAFGRFSDDGLGAILSKCKALRELDIRGCWNVKLEDEIESKCVSIISFKSPWEDVYGDLESSGDEGGNADNDEDEDDDNDDAWLVDVEDDDEVVDVEVISDDSNDDWD